MTLYVAAVDSVCLKHTVEVDLCDAEMRRKGLSVKCSIICQDFTIWSHLQSLVVYSVAL